MNWDWTFKRVSGKYLNQFDISGVVQSSRVKYGGHVQHTIILDSQIEVFGDIREKVLMTTEELTLI